MYHCAIDAIPSKGAVFSSPSVIDAPDLPTLSQWFGETMRELDIASSECCEGHGFIFDETICIGYFSYNGKVQKLDGKCNLARAERILAGLLVHQQFPF